MKKIYLLLTLTILCFVLNAQIKSPGDTTEVELITFESESVFFKQGTPTTNIWQIGQPSKLTFTEAYSAPNAIVTDTLKTYPANNHSWFDLVLYPSDFGYTYRGIEFMHKINTEATGNGGYITVSYDLGSTWTNIIEDSAYFNYWDISPANEFNNLNLYSNNDTLYNGEYGFSGAISKWEKVQFGWYFSSYIKRSQWQDTMLIRFNFISGANDAANDGWMIDNIRLFWVGLGWSINEQTLISNLEIFPNPVHDNSIIQTKDKRQIKYIQVYNLTGQLLREEIVGDYSFIFERKGLPSGTFLVKCVFAYETRETLKMIIQ